MPLELPLLRIPGGGGGGAGGARAGGQACRQNDTEGNGGRRRRGRQSVGDCKQGLRPNRRSHPDCPSPCAPVGEPGSQGERGSEGGQPSGRRAFGLQEGSSGTTEVDADSNRASPGGRFMSRTAPCQQGKLPMRAAHKLRARPTPKTLTYTPAQAHRHRRQRACKPPGGAPTVLAARWGLQGVPPCWASSADRHRDAEPLTQPPAAIQCCRRLRRPSRTDRRCRRLRPPLQPAVSSLLCSCCSTLNGARRGDEPVA